MADDYSGIATPVGANASDYSSFASPVQPTGGANPYAGIATPAKTSAASPTKPTGWDELIHGQADPDHPNLWNVVYGLQGAYKSAGLNGLMAEPVRAAMEGTGYGMSRLKQMYPNQTDDWYQQKLHSAYNDALTGARQDAANQVKANPYPGSSVANFGAGVLGSADPTWAINPVAGMERLAAVKGAAGVATRIGASAAAHAALSSASDGAAQVMDIAEGQKKNFDIQRNLEAASFGGAFGGASQGLGEVGNAPVVSDFVKGLFGKRGVDTLPPETPKGVTSPTTGDTPTLTPEQTGQLRDLIRNGSVDDIKGFLADKQGPKPSWSDVNQLVQARDTMPENAVQRYKDAIDQHLADTHAQVLDEHFQNQMKDWTNKPDVEVIHNAQDIADPSVRDQSVASGLNDQNTVGFVGPDGKVRVFAGAVKTPEQANAVLFHEGLGHYGLQQKFGAGLDKTLDTLTTRNVGQFGKAVDDWQKQNPGAYNGNKTRAAEEVLAEMSQNGQVKPSIGDALVSHVRRFGRQMGMKLSYSDAEVSNILSMAHDSVINGRGRDAAINGFRSMVPEQTTGSFQTDENPFVKGRGEMSDEDVHSIMSEPHGTGDASTFDPNAGRFGAMSDEDVRNTLAKPDDASAYAPFASRVLPDEDVKQIQSEDTGSKFMTPEQLLKTAKDTHEEAFNKFGEGYTPKFKYIAEAQEAAHDTALDYSAIKKSKGVGELDKKLFVYDNAAAQANAKLLALADKAAQEGGLSHEDIADLVQTTNDFHYVLGRLDNDLGNVGRALNAAKQITFRRGNILAMKEALEAEHSPLGPLIDPETASKFLKQFAALAKSNSNPAGAANLLKSVQSPYWWQYALSWRQNAMLSGLSTHLKSTMDMATTAGREFEEKLAALPLGAVRGMARSMGMKGVQEGIHPSEVALHAWGIARAVLDAQTYKDMGAAFQTGSNPRFAGRGMQNPNLGPIASLPTKAIAAQDSFFRNVLDSGHLYALGARKAKAQGLTSWDDITTAGAGHARTPTQGMLDEAQELTANTMLLNKSPLNDALDRAKRIKPGMNGMEQLGSFMINYLTPFVRVQSNALMNQIVRRSPASFLDPVTRADWAAGGSRRDLAIMRTVVGSAILVNMWNQADPNKGKLTGTGPDNTDKVKEMEASGWAQGAVHENGRYNTNSNLNISLNPFDMHNNTASLVAGVREAFDEGMNKGKVGLGFNLAMASVMHDLTNQTFVNDLGEAWDAFHQQGETGLKKMQQFAGKEATSFIPNVVKQTAKTIDPIARDTTGGIGDQIKASIPGLTGQLPARQTVYGDPAHTGTSVTGIHTWLTSGNGQNETTDPAEKELARLGNLYKETLVTPVQRTITVKDTSSFSPDQITDAGKGSVKLTPEQFEQYQHMAGNEIVQTMKDRMADPDWPNLSDDQKATWVRKMQTQKKKAVREYLYGNH